MSFSTDIDKVLKNLHNIDKYLDGQIRGKKIFDKAARIVITEMKTQVPEDEGVLKKSIGRLYSRKSGNSVMIGGKFGRKNRPTNHASLVNNGFVAVNGKYVPGTPYVERTFVKTKALIEASIISELKTAFNVAGKSHRGFL